MLPPALSPRWLLVLVATAALWTGLVVLFGYLNSGQPPTLEHLRGAAMALLLVAGLPVLCGFLGARLGFLGAQVGLLVGYVLMLRSVEASSGGFEDLAAVAMFLLLGASGLGLGLLLDIGRYFIGKKG